MRHALLLATAAMSGLAMGPAFAQPRCGKACLEEIGTAYRTAYLAHDPKLAPFGRSVRFTENNVEMRLPDGTWDTVTQEVGPALTISDPVSGNVGIYTTIMQKDVPGFLAIRLKVAGGKITEVEQVISTKRNLSSPPTPIGPIEGFAHDPDLARPVDPRERTSRTDLVRIANGYFTTLENNNGEIRDTKFSPTATRFENGMKFPDVEKGFKSGRYHFNERVRDRDFVLVDEARGIVMARGFIDHKGVLDTFQLTDGTPQRSVFREPQTWGLLEMFKIKHGEITGIEATFIQTAYYMRSPWTAHPDMRPGGITPPAPPAPPSSPAPTNPPLPE
ncbi:hypothetical protein [Sphingomonas sp. MMS24-J13]|uniref:hypothetical protein n=1 Tax=Sphingomonas sp. MMS24-J13 TaxID=3238686 RepID=UPI003850B8E7